MNKADTESAIAVMQAYVDGAEIEYANRSIPAVGKGIEWDSHQHDVNFDWHSYEYRIKPKPREFWICNANKNGGSGHYWISQEDKDTGHWSDASPIKVREVTE